MKSAMPSKRRGGFRRKSGSGGVTKRRTKTAFETLTEKLDDIFSKFIRLRDAHDWHQKHPEAAFGYVSCCTCGIIRDWKEVDCGHYIGRRSHNTRWEEFNCHAQCKGCNCNEGKKPEYGLYLQQRYGPEIIERLVIAGKRVKSWAPIELEALIVHYTQEVEKLKHGG